MKKVCLNLRKLILIITVSSIIIGKKKYQENFKQIVFRQNILNLKWKSLNLINCELIPLNRKQEIKILRILWLLKSVNSLYERGKFRSSWSSCCGISVKSIYSLKSHFTEHAYTWILENFIFFFIFNVLCDMDST